MAAWLTSCWAPSPELGFAAAAKCQQHGAGQHRSPTGQTGQHPRRILGDSIVVGVVVGVTAGGRGGGP